METGTAFTTLDYDTGERFVRLRQRLGVSTFGLNQIVLEAGQRGRIHRHKRQEEVYVVLEGTPTLELDGGEERRLGVGDAARVGPDVRRRLTNHGPGRVALLAIGGEGTHEGRDGLAWDGWGDRGEPRSPVDVPLPPDLSAP
jgi:mannose-6-phosphate isomerase-like protein (cupin superfamily)